MRLHIDALTVPQVHDLIDAGLFPFALCWACGATPVSVHCEDGQWSATCPSCDSNIPTTLLSWRDATGISEAGWVISPADEATDILFDVRRNQAIQ